MTNRDFISEVERIISEHNRPPSMNRRSRHGDLQGERRRIEAITGDERLWLYACKQAVQQQKDSWLNEIVSTENPHWMLRFLSNEQRSRLENNIDAPIAQAIAGSALAAFHMLNIADDQSLLDEVLYQLYQATSRWQQVHRPDLQNPITSSTDILSTLRDELDAEQTPLLLLQNIVASFHKHLPNWHIGPIRDLIHFFWESDEPAMQSETVIQTEEVQVAVLIHLDDTTGLVAILELEAIPSGTEHLYPDPRFMAFFKPDLSFRQALETAWKYARLQSWYREHHDVRWRMFALTTPQHRFRQVQQANGGSIGAGCALALLYLFDTQRQSKNMASWAITGGVNENGLITSVTGYASKLDAARQQNRKVVFPADDRERVRHLIDTDPSLESLERYPVLSIEAAAETIATDTPFVPSLDWPELCNRGQIISEKFILQITTRQLYEEQNRVISIPYLQRARVYQSFQRFLTSDKRCFVLIGKSGMGKSSFLLSMGKNLLSRTDICVLMYDAQQIYGNLDAVIAADVIGLDTQDSEDDSRISDFWQYIQQKVGLDKRAILFIDAINEHSQAQHLLRQVDKLVRKPWPWLKIVISSRPETWKVIRQPVSLDEQNYYRETSTDPTMQNAPFDHSEQMEPFTRNELPEVYTLYQQAFDLKTSYNDFVHRKTQLLKIVEDPLSLRLVAITYAGQAIPDTLKASKVVEQYIQMMVDSAILREESIDLLSENILPLMLRPPQYRNHLIREDIDAADTESRRLRQAIYEDSGGRLHFSTAFRMLIDSELLAYQETDSYINLNISFRYERFYDYFVGKAMLRWAQSATEQKNFFEEKICQTKNTDTGGYLLWGGIRNALMWYTQRKEHTIDIQPLLSLCFTDQQRVKEMMSSVLTELGQENEVDSVLREIISEPEQNNRLQRLHRLIPVDAWAKAAVQPLWMRMPMKNVEAIAQTQQQREQERKNKNAQKIAIEVAANLNRAWVLLSAARQADPQIRAIAVYHIYRLWLREPHIGFAIMQRLAEDAAPDIIPDIPLLEAVTHLSLIVFFNHAKKAFVEQQTRYRNQDQVDNNNSSVIGYQQQNYVSNSRINASQVQNIWRGILARVLGLHEEQRKYARLFREMLREGLFRSLIGVVFRFTEESWLKHYSSLYADFDGFFRLSKTEKELYYRLVQYLNLEGDYSREQMEQDFIAAFSINNRLVWFVFLLAITTHGISYQHDFLPTLKRLFDESYRYSVPNTYLLAVNSALASMLNHNPDEDEVYDYLIDTIEVCQDYCAEYAHLPELKLSFQDPRAYGLGPYIHNTYRRKGTARSDWLISRVNAALDEHNIAFFEFLLGTELPVRRPHIALDTLPLFFNKGNQAVDTLVQLYLARLHVFYPDAVDRFLEEQNAPEAMRNEISRIEPVETIGDLVGMQAWFYLRDDMILYSPAQRQWIMRIFLQAVECRNVREWLDYFLREIINTIYGETIFTRRQKRDES